MSTPTPGYPVTLTVDYPDRPVNRLTSFFRIFTLIPIGFVAWLMAQALPLALGTNSWKTSGPEVENFQNSLSRIADGLSVPDIVVFATAAAVLAPIAAFVATFVWNLFNPIVLMLVFRHKYPAFWFDFYAGVLRFLYRVATYATLISDVYPSTDEDQNVHLVVTYPNAEKELSAGLPLIKWFLAIPHYFVLAFVILAAIVVDVIIWFAILFTGRVPRGMFDFVVGTMRWGLRVESYAFFHFTDKYPPFSLE